MRTKAVVNDGGKKRNDPIKNKIKEAWDSFANTYAEAVVKEKGGQALVNEARKQKQQTAQTGTPAWRQNAQTARVGQPTPQPQAPAAQPTPSAAGQKSTPASVQSTPAPRSQTAVGNTGSTEKQSTPSANSGDLSGKAPGRTQTEGQGGGLSTPTEEDLQKESFHAQYRAPENEAPQPAVADPREKELAEAKSAVEEAGQKLSWMKKAQISSGGHFPAEQLELALAEYDAAENAYSDMLDTLEREEQEARLANIETDLSSVGECLAFCRSEMDSPIQSKEYAKAISFLRKTRESLHEEGLSEDEIQDTFEYLEKQYDPADGMRMAWIEDDEPTEEQAESETPVEKAKEEKNRVWWKMWIQESARPFFGDAVTPEMLEPAHQEYEEAKNAYSEELEKQAWELNERLANSKTDLSSVGKYLAFCQSMERSFALPQANASARPQEYDQALWLLAETRESLREEGFSEDEINAIFRHLESEYNAFAAARLAEMNREDALERGWLGNAAVEAIFRGTDIYGATDFSCKMH